MKRQTLSLIAAAVALTLTTTPFVAQAQDASPSRQPRKEFAGKGAWEKLGLSEEQKARIMEIRRNTRAEMEEVLTTEQKEQLKANMQRMRNDRSQRRERGEWKKNNPFAALNLTEEQKTRMREIKESSKQQMQEVLTPTQREQLKQMWENKGSRRQRQQRNSDSI